MKQPAYRSICVAWLLLMGLNGLGGRGNADQCVVVVLDDSGSMEERLRSAPNMTRMMAAKTALRDVLAQLSDEARVGIVLLNGNRVPDRWLVPLEKVDMTKVDAALVKVVAAGGTPLGDTMKMGAEALLKARAAEHYGSFRLLLVTDGEATDPAEVEAYLPEILARGLTVDVIGVDMASNHSLATQVHSYRRADDPESLRRAVEEVFAETSSGASDTSAEDFTLLEALPTDVAAAVLVELSRVSNDPIDGIASSESPDEVGPFQSHPGTGGGAAPRPEPVPPPNKKLNTLAIVFFLAVLLYLVSSRLSKKRR